MKLSTFLRSATRVTGVASFITALGLVGASLATAQIRAQALKPDSGTLLAFANGQITLQDSQGEETTFKIQTEDNEPLILDGRRLKFPAKISAQGELPVNALRNGSVVVFTAHIAKGGRVAEAVGELTWMVDDPPAPSVKPTDGSLAGEEIGVFRVVGSVLQRKDNRVTLTVPRGRFVPRGRLAITVTPDAIVKISSTSLSLVRPGDKVSEFQAVKFSTGDFVIRSIKVELSAATAERTLSVDDQLAEKYAAKSNEPSPPREFRSKHFLLQTDISDRQASILLDKLETMIQLVSRYYGRPPRDIIRCYVVRDLEQWPVDQLDPAGVAKIRSREGITISRSLGRQRTSVVYSCDKHQVVQHESVHAYCSQTFGSTGPTWYSEGMAEMGAYWTQGEKAVKISTPVIRHLTRAEPKQLLEIVAAGQITGDSWQAYAWRWALCHMLANNPNYSKRFKLLGMAMMSGEPATFESTFGDIAPELSFEYAQFVQNFGNGYRADLCAWQWNPAKLIPKKGRVKRTVLAAAGWQATQLKLLARQEYEYAATGSWQTSPAGDKLSAQGQDNGHGQLVGAILTDDYKLSNPIPLGGRGKFTAPTSGQLYLRCQDDWTQVADNVGELTVYLRVPPKTK